ncbi:MAG: vitamin K epoxide reductase family protein [Candidatus Marsarchaeota archaeon]|nr:vitamin K epoxide reductase family protein [Candidatus Marsarchaeota archaeon]MCL5413060.1 vitamin K epoxide reductase family protein [Candidatus Marsarchaeota archaeon]
MAIKVAKIIGLQRIAFAISVIGLAVSIYLIGVQYAAAPLVCPSVGIINCETVLTSQYSKIFGIGNSVLGTIFFLIDLVIISKYFGKDVMVLYNTVGLAFIIYYISAEYLLGKICLYCTIVHICVLLLFLISIKSNMKKNQ